MTMTEAEKEKLEVAGKDAKKDANEEIPAWADAFKKDMLDAVGEMLMKHARDASEKEPVRTPEAADAKRKDEEGFSAKEDPTENTEGQKRDESEEERKKREAEGGRKANEELEGERKEKERLEADRKRRDEGDTDRDTDLEDRARRDASAAKVRSLESELAAMKHQMGSLMREPTYEDKNRIAEARARADQVFQVVTGREAPAPIPGESPIAYRKRLADTLRAHTAEYKDERLDALTGKAFDLVEQNIYADAMESAKAVLSAPGRLPTYTKREWYGNYFEEPTGGDPAAVFAPFTLGSGGRIKLSNPRH
jgi:hypothetical protein